MWQVSVYLVARFLFVCVGTRDLCVASYWIDTLVRKTEGNTYATLLHHPFLFKGKPTLCSRGGRGGRGSPRRAQVGGILLGLLVGFGLPPFLLPEGGEGKRGARRKDNSASFLGGGAPPLCGLVCSLLRSIWPISSPGGCR